MFMQTVKQENCRSVVRVQRGSADHLFKAIYNVPKPTVRIVCFSGAGASASFFRFWRAFGGTEMRIVAYQPSGRDRRWANGNSSLDVSAREVADAIAAHTSDRRGGRLILFGHSYGALIAYEVAQLLRLTGIKIDHLIVAARAAPYMAPTAQLAAELPDGALIAALRGLGLDDRKVLDHPALGPLCLASLRHDLNQNATYVDTHCARLDCPVTALSGTRDPLAPPLAMANWQNTTRGRFFHHRMNGSHFFPTNMPQRVARIVKARAGAIS